MGRLCSGYFSMWMRVGFGVLIQTDIDALQYPEIRAMKPGEKTWVTGEIKEVAVTGTGTVYLQAEEVRFKEGLMEAIGKSKQIAGNSRNASNQVGMAF